MGLECFLKVFDITLASNKDHVMCEVGHGSTEVSKDISYVLDIEKKM